HIFLGRSLRSELFSQCLDKLLVISDPALPLAAEPNSLTVTVVSTCHDRQDTAAITVRQR
ncbi:MAG: hypothetical protein WBL55_02045, partial [Xanthobacteraceae bacterium]